MMTKWTLIFCQVEDANMTRLSPRKKNLVRCAKHSCLTESIDIIDDTESSTYALGCFNATKADVMQNVNLILNHRADFGRTASNYHVIWFGDVYLAVNNNLMSDGAKLSAEKFCPKGKSALYLWLLEHQPLPLRGCC